MRVLNEIGVDTGKEKIFIHFGIADTEEEKKNMYKLRCEVYARKKNYIPEEECTDGMEIDQYDKDGKCTYIIAKAKGKVIGTTRIIEMDPLPIKKHYFSFSEPNEFKEIKPEEKCEIGRLISVGKVEDTYLPRHLIMLGMFDAVGKYAEEKGIQAVYGAIKKYVFDKLEKISFPAHVLKDYRIIYDPNCEDPLKNFFTNKNDPVIPIYLLRRDGVDYLEKMFSKKFIFKKTNDNKNLYNGDIGMFLFVLGKKVHIF